MATVFEPLRARLAYGRGSSVLDLPPLNYERVEGARPADISDWKPYWSGACWEERRYALGDRLIVISAYNAPCRYWHHMVGEFD